LSVVEDAYSLKAKPGTKSFRELLALLRDPPGVELAAVTAERERNAPCRRPIPLSVSVLRP